jgi:hypothetical protein
MRLPRMTVRRWMIAVVAIWIGFALSRSIHRRMLAAEHGSKCRYYADSALTIEHGLIGKTLSPVVAERLIADGRNRAHYHARLREKYLQATLRPWESVPLDPPPPDDSKGNNRR